MIHILDADFSQLNQIINQINPSQIFVLCDENTHQYCVPEVLSNLTTEIPLEIIEIEPGEELKTIETATMLWETLNEFETDRNSLIMNIGGGVITDMGGFVASTYKRGIKFINLPTTLLAMCDASIGGKTGIDLNFYKNIVGTFAQPEGIFVNTHFLQSLPYEELRSGFAEMLKHGLIANEKHWHALSSLEELSAESIATHIETSMKVKEKIVDADFREQNIRKNLNFGHTIGHAIESLFIKSGKPILHGEAVALGMICETQLSLNKNLINNDEAQKITSALIQFYPLYEISGFSFDEILSLMKNDKKNANGNINFSLLSAIGTGVYNQLCTDEEIKKSLAFYQSLAQ